MPANREVVNQYFNSLDDKIKDNLYENVRKLIGQKIIEDENFLNGDFEKIYPKIQTKDNMITEMNDDALAIGIEINELDEYPKLWIENLFE